jgi:hypothetical protein
MHRARHQNGMSSLAHVRGQMSREIAPQDHILFLDFFSSITTVSFPTESITFSCKRCLIPVITARRRALAKATVILGSIANPARRLLVM